MLTYTLSALLLGSCCSATVMAKAGGSRRNNVHRRKLLKQKEFEKELYGNSKHSAALREKFMSKSIFVGGRKLQNYNNYNNNNGYVNNNGWNNNGYNNNGNKNNNNGYYDYNGYYHAYNNNYNQEADEADEAEEAEVNYDNYQANEDANAEEDVYYGQDGEYAIFNPSNYAISYHRCAAVKQFDSEVAATEDSERVFSTKNFAIFRFCPVDTCDYQVYDDADGENNGGDDQDDDEDEDGDEERRLEDAAEDEGDDEVDEDADNVEDDDEDNDGRVYQRDNKKYGARGRGCRSDYGEYMIELEDYLQIMMEHQQELKEQYCAYCENYMYDVYMQYYGNDNDDGGNNRRALFTYEHFKNDPASHRKLESDYSKCAQFPYVCNGDDDGDGATEYLECTEGGNDDDDGSSVYIGPHCAEDGFTITLGAYADEDCDEYIGGDVSAYLSEDDDDGDDDGSGYDLVNYYNSRHGSLSVLYEGQESSMCIPCSEEYSYTDDDSKNDDKNNGNDNTGAMSALCQQLYDSSAHCEKHYKTFNKKNLSDKQWEETQLSCSFIDSIVMGNYDEMGYVNLKWTWGLWGNNKQGKNVYAPKYASVTTNVSPLQVFFLVFSILACIILAVWSKTLHASLTKTKEPWSPRHSWNMNKIFRRQEPETEISPAESGIGASRVRSDGTSYYLT